MQQINVFKLDPNQSCIFQTQIQNTFLIKNIQYIFIIKKQLQIFQLIFLQIEKRSNLFLSAKSNYKSQLRSQNNIQLYLQSTDKLFTETKTIQLIFQYLDTKILCTDQFEFLNFFAKFIKPSKCNYCGNNILQYGEQYDNSNKKGCVSCKIQPGYNCRIDPRYCYLIKNSCGNGERQIQEQCDDGNKVNGGGCSNLCKIETGQTCSLRLGEKSSCQLVASTHQTSKTIK